MAMKKTAKKKPVKKKAKPAAATPAGLIEPGHAAPAFTLHNQANEPVALKDLRGRWVALYFYPKDDTPGCTTQACGFRDEAEAFARRGAVVIGVSADDVKSHARFARKFALPFHLLADADHAVCEAYGVWREKSMYGRTFMGVVRTTYLINPAGKVVQRWDKVKPEGHEKDVLAAIDARR